MMPRAPAADAPPVLPQPLARWAEALLGQGPAPETHASCSSCAMCSQDRLPPGPAPIRFSPRTRCCTYRPPLVNHVAGRLLHSPALQHQLDTRLAAAEATPMGVRVDPRYQLLYRHAMADAFGRADSLRCPHQADDGGCGIWAVRPAVCATWFCKHERGAVGQRLWKALHACFSRAEHLLALWCLGELGFNGQARARALRAFEDDRFDADALDQRPDSAPQRALWGGWFGREADFYRACADRVAALSWAQVEALGGTELSLLADQAREAARAHADLGLPDALQLGSFTVLGARDGRLWLQTHSEFDPLAVSPDVLQLVARCKGHSPAGLAEAHAAAGHHPPTRRLLRTLVDFGVLQAAGSADG